ncbi:MAG: hypothetical protein RQ783_02200 [Gammaproteobacteria bacterium]|nr:hypothetical protein [Gammaproteobacteria bacterium]
MTLVNSSAITHCRLVYILFLVNILVPFLGIIGVVMAYVNKDDAPEWLQSHYQFQIRTFWFGLAYVLLGMLLTIILIGYFILLFTAFWIIIRCVKGMKYLDNQQAHPNPGAWMFD